MVLGLFMFVFGISLCCTTLSTWFFIVIGSLSICAWLKGKVPSDALVLYFTVSVLGGLLYLLSATNQLLSSIFLQVALLLKLGLAPFQFWVYKVLSHLPLVSLCLFLGP